MCDAFHHFISSRRYGMDQGGCALRVPYRTVQGIIALVSFISRTVTL
jgi:hypothetical protein